MTSTDSSYRHRLAPVAIVFFAAVVMGIPTVGGGFVGGDDHRLALNHVLVNHPSFEHAIKLFTTPHRDLYQPLPMLTFSAEFAIANALGLFKQGVAGGTWLFHLTNVLLHGLNAVLVWLVICRLHERSGAAGLRRPNEAVPAAGVSDAGRAAPAVATLAALLFAIHPIQVEVVAWTNGRMMLMSTLFALLSLLSFASWLDRPRPRSAALTIVFVILSALSKVRIGLPILLLIVPLARRTKLGWRFLWLWLVCGLVTGVFVLVNIWATSGADLFAEAAEHLRGPRLVRVILALACYFQHLVWPVGLASYYPTPPLVSWSDAETWRAVAIVVPAFALLAWACWRSHIARLGVLWFFATLWVTLPFVPARNVLAADRYMYLPIIGLLWLAATLGWWAYQRILALSGLLLARVIVGVLAALVIPTCIGVSWHVGGFYATPLKKTTRITQLYPNTPRVWERLGWTLYGNEEYGPAIECAKKELLLRYDSPNVIAGAHQLMGMAEVRRGNADEGLALLRKAIEIDPKNPLGKYRLAMAFDELDRFEEALTWYEAVVEAAPTHNPSLNRLGWLYHRAGRLAEACGIYEKALENNEYDVNATMGLVELDIEQGTRESLTAAERRLMELLDWMDENVDAWTNLGVVRMELRKTETRTERAQAYTRKAVEAYNEAFKRDPNHVLAALNLGQIYYAAGDITRAWPLFLRAVEAGLASVDEAVVVHDVFVAQNALDRAVALWEDVVARLPDSADARALLAWSRALADDWIRARAEAEALVGDLQPSGVAADTQPSGSPGHSLAWATLAYVDLSMKHYSDAAVRTETLCELGDRGSDARRRLLGALERFDQMEPDVPWTFCLTARLLMVDGKRDAAGLFLELCEQRCRDDACQALVQRLRSRLAGTTPAGSGASDAP